jgi:hypothetical protein
MPVDRFRVVDPGALRLPPGRQYGPDKARYLNQSRRFGAGMMGFPPIEVTEGRNGELMINNGVTRATRIHTMAAGQTVPIEVIDVRPQADFSRLKRVRDIPPPQ